MIGDIVIILWFIQTYVNVRTFLCIFVGKISTHLRGIYQLYVLRFRILRWKNVSMCSRAYLQLPISWRSHVGSGEVFEIVGGMQYAKLPLRSILLRESRNFILKTYIYP